MRLLYLGTIAFGDKATPLHLPQIIQNEKNNYLFLNSAGIVHVNLIGTNYPI